MTDLLHLLAPSLPYFVVGVDPDGSTTAVTVLRRRLGSRVYEIDSVRGGGRQRDLRNERLGDVIGASVVLRGLVEAARELHESVSDSGDWEADEYAVALAIEAQTFNGPHSADVEGCRRARWHWDAAAVAVSHEASSSAPGLIRVTHVQPRDWERVFVGDEGGGERAYRSRCEQLYPGRVRNGDQAASLGIAWWMATHVLGASVDGGVA
jgi:hypothetical protein